MTSSNGTPTSSPKTRAVEQGWCPITCMWVDDAPHLTTRREVLQARKVVEGMQRWVTVKPLREPDPAPRLYGIR